MHYHNGRRKISIVRRKRLSRRRRQVGVCGLRRWRAATRRGGCSSRVGNFFDGKHSAERYGDRRRLCTGSNFMCRPRRCCAGRTDQQSQWCRFVWYSIDVWHQAGGKRRREVFSARVVQFFCREYFVAVAETSSNKSQVRSV